MSKCAIMNSKWNILIRNCIKFRIKCMNIDKLMHYKQLHRKKLRCVEAGIELLKQRTRREQIKSHGLKCQVVKEGRYWIEASIQDNQLRSGVWCQYVCFSVLIQKKNKPLIMYYLNVILNWNLNEKYIRHWKEQIVNINYQSNHGISSLS